MAAVPPQPTISERGDIHKSCRALEAVVNILNDYSEAARAIVTLQKKLAKALRDAAGCKATGEIASNAFGSSANVFEALSDIDSKYAKIADKECDAVTAEVRKWFKKLAKEEKIHDDRIAAANARLKSAGASYEKKAKKNTYDAAEEHTRYIALLTSLGPEMTQEKYNHQLGVSQRSTAVTYGVAATAARLADAEWLRAAEGVRRFAPLIGSVGEWRSLCEGGWTAPLPEPLPDLDAPSQPQPKAQSGGSPLPPYIVPSNVLANLRPRTPNEQPSQPVPDQPQAAAPATTPAVEELPPLNPEDRNRTISMANLASFPNPPTHFPLPPLRKPLSPRSESPTKQLASSPLAENVSSTEESQVAKPQEVFQRSDSSTAPDSEAQSSSRATGSTSESTPPTSTAAHDKLPLEPTHSDEPAKPFAPSATPSSPTKPSMPRFERAQVSFTTSSSSRTGSPYAGPSSGALPKGDYLEDRDFAPSGGPDKTRSLDSASPRRGIVERTDTLRSSGSVASNTRDKLARMTGPGSPPPRDIPRLNQSVTEIASKFQQSGSGADTSSRRPLMSPTFEDAPPRRAQDAPAVKRAQDATDPRQRRSIDFPESPGAAARPATMYADDIDRRRARVAELEDLERRERELEERAKERRWREESMARRPDEDRRGLLRLQEEDERSLGSARPGRSPEPPREREDATRLRTPGRSPEPSSRTSDSQHGYAEPARAYSRDSYSGESARAYAPRPVSMASGTLQPPSMTSRYSYSSTHLAQPQPTSPGAGARSPRASSDQPFPATSPGPALGVSGHPGNCACPACTVERAANGVPPEPRERKPSGWRRRLSMPVIIPFAGEGKKEKGIMGGRPLGHQANSSVTSFGGRR